MNIKDYMDAILDSFDEALLQTRLLRVRQDREIFRIGDTEPLPVDVRFVAATNRDIQKFVNEGRFCSDL